jgi:hypothetical protein
MPTFPSAQIVAIINLHLGERSKITIVMILLATYVFRELKPFETWHHLN